MTRTTYETCFNNYDQGSFRLICSFDRAPCDDRHKGNVPDPLSPFHMFPSPHVSLLFTSPMPPVIRSYILTAPFIEWC